jgi:molecular chaperone DnaK
MNAFGIDFGTTNSVLAMWNGQTVEVLPVDEPPVEWARLGFDRVLPSVLGVVSADEITFGWVAKRQPEAKLEAVKRLFASADHVDIGGHRVTVEEAAALLFAHLRAASPGVTVDRAVVTIPANSRGVARFRTKVSAGLAGIEVPALLNEPTAAAMAYSVDAAEDQNLLVFDWGGGTLDVTVLETIEGVFIERASKGIQRLGGIDLDAALGNAIINELPRRPAWSPSQQARFRLEVERVKILLSTQHEANLELPDGGYFTVSRELFTKAIASRLDEVRLPIQQCLTDLSISPNGIDQLIMVGGSSKIPAARKLVSDLLRREPAGGCDPMTAVAQGAAIASAILAGQLDKDFFVATEHALGTIVHDERENAGFSVLIPRNHQLPATAEDDYVPLYQGQEAVRVEVIEGDPTKPIDHEDNVILKEWTIAIDPTRPHDDSVYTMTYNYDVDGILHVVIVDRLTGNEVLHDDVSFGVTRDGSNLVQIATHLRDAIASGRIGGRRTPPVSGQADPETATLLRRARTKVIPFVDDDEAKRLAAICADLEHATGDAVAECRRALGDALRQYAYLF